MSIFAFLYWLSVAIIAFLGLGVGNDELRESRPTKWEGSMILDGVAMYVNLLEEVTRR